MLTLARNINLIGFHSARIPNQERVYNAEQNLEYKKKKELERQKVLEQELAFEANRKLLGKISGNDPDSLKGKGGALSFMYEPPPGYALHENSSENPEVLQAHALRNATGALTKGNEKSLDGEDDSSKFNPDAVRPLGLDIRNVRCVKCKQWGHHMGDSVCPMKAVSVETEKFRQQIEDPLMVFDRSRGAAVTDRLVLRQSLDGIHGGEAADAANQQA